MKNWICLLLSLLLFSCQSNAQKKRKETKVYPITKTDAEWKAELPEMAYYVLREAVTERAFSGSLNKFYEDGLYVCAGCQTPLYESEHKYDSKSGWPSFDRGIDENLEYDVDYKIGYARTELKCNVCGGHLGHMFEDGPRNTTGKRHCINSAALNFIPAADGQE
ncbi:MAG: peptide-methionine (R)-S-oxide reductase MsrB [Flavobacteriaceae bacterium]